jgi:predicted nucleotide-binding protein (sugar kinase/HSP70/actin superfamily)
MKVGIPNGLLNCRYGPFFETFFESLGAEVITSQNTNKDILDAGVKYAVDEACLPVKIFHGHVASIKDKCDVIVIPRIMQIEKNEYICPKFCGLPEMVLNSISNMPLAITYPIYASTDKSLYRWAICAGRFLRSDIYSINEAFGYALEAQKSHRTGIRQDDFEIRVALSGHPYNVYDSFINMDIVSKLNNLGVGVLTEELGNYKSFPSDRLFKRMFWTLARENYNFSVNSSHEKNIDGIIYISSFNCGIDSFLIEMIKSRTGDFPFLVLKVDEHTGEAGILTRIEAFVDMLERRLEIENNISSHG